jgi:hypothetical protein
MTADAPGLGLHVELNGDGEVLFAPLTADVDDIAIWVEETLAAWGSNHPALFFDPAAIGEVIESLEREREWLKENSGPNGLKAVPFDTSRSKPPRWVWQDRLLIGYINLLIGNEGVGKGTLMSHVIASVVKGDLPGSLRGRPSNVAIIGDEDSFGDVWVPRLVAAGVPEDTKRIVQLERPDGGFIELKADRYRIAKFVREHDIKLLFMDQLLDNLGVEVNDYRQKQVRDALRPARWLARELEIAVVGSLHPNKRGESFSQLVAGSRSFNALSRSSLLLAQHPQVADRVVLVRGKGNLSGQPEALDFTIESAKFQLNGHDWDVPRVADLKTADLSVADVMAQYLPEKTGQTAGGSSRRQFVASTIRAELEDGKWHPSKPITDRLTGEGFSESMISNARKDVGVEHDREGMPAITVWRLPVVSDSADSPND